MASGAAGIRARALALRYDEWSHVLAYSKFVFLWKKDENEKCVRSTRMPRQAQVPWYPSQVTSVANTTTSVANGHDENSMLRQGGAYC